MSVKNHMASERSFRSRSTKRFPAMTSIPNKVSHTHPHRIPHTNPQGSPSLPPLDSPFEDEKKTLPRKSIATTESAETLPRIRPGQYSLIIEE